MNVPLLTNATIEELEAELRARRAAIEAAQPPPDPSVPAYRVTIDVLSLNGDVDGVQELISALENLRHPEFLNVIEVKRKDLPEWSDDHPFNQHATQDAASDAWFKDAPVVWRRGDS